MVVDSCSRVIVLRTGNQEAPQIDGCASCLTLMSRDMLHELAWHMA